MIKLFTEEEFHFVNYNEKLPLKCEGCGITFFREKRFIKFEDIHNTGRLKYCNKPCMNEYKKLGEYVTCVQCGVVFYKKLSEIKKTKSGRHFHSQSCAATYNNTHKTHGTRRSKLEQLIEDYIKANYKELNVQFNDKTIIGSEIDILIPDHNIAIEINGIYHYKPIHGEEKLRKIQAMDKIKIDKCEEMGITLHIIDTSSHTYVTEKSSKKYLDMIDNILVNVQRPPRAGILS